MITLQELNRKGHVLSESVSANLAILSDKINKVRSLYGIPMIVTSGYRTADEQAAINPAAMHSKHMTGQAVDIADPKGELKAWIMDHLPEIEAIGFWFEDFAHTASWVHFQVVPPSSGKRFFIP